jgi:uncharacterized protein YdaU (DUF1376 family)
MAQGNGNGTAPVKLTGMIWWIDRWRKSTAFVDMTAEEQGAYRNLIDEAWLRGGVIPDNPRAIAKVSCAEERWPKIKRVVMERFYLADGGWRNATVDEVIRRATRGAKKQRAYRERRGNKPGNATVTKSVTRSVTRR